MVGKFIKLANIINLLLVVNNQQIVDKEIKNKINDVEKRNGVEKE